ncbi:MAG: hypothetical protein OEW21_07450 [Betaproteobacteria bacterium]|nr:hypothetical protein [Betaproteobacteria bacterium]
MNKPTLFARRTLLLSALVLAVLAAAAALFAWPQIRARLPGASQPPLRLEWIWRKNIDKAEAVALAASFNGERLAAAVTSSASGAERRFVYGIDNESRLFTVFEAADLRELQLDGSGRALLTQDASGALKFLADWQTESGKPVALGVAAAGAQLAPGRRSVLARAPGPQGSWRLLDAAGAAAQNLADSPAGETLRAWYPFLERPTLAALAYADGRLQLYEGTQRVQAHQFDAPLLAAASGVLSNQLLAVVAGKAPARLFLLADDGGRPLGMWSLPAAVERVSLACGQLGQACALLAVNGERRLLYVVSAQGRLLSQHEGGGAGVERVEFGDEGRMLVAAFEAQGQWSLHAWDLEGRVLWSAPIEGRLVDFRLSWSGKRLMAVTGEGKVLYFDTERRRPAKVSEAPRGARPG